VERSNRRGSERPSRRICRPLLQGGKAGSDRSHFEGERARAHHNRDRRQDGKPGWHLQIADRWIVQYNFYVNDQRWGRMFVRMCPYVPFSARVCLNQHHWRANRMREERVDFEQCSNAFRNCAAPKRLKELSDSLMAEDLLICGQKWLDRFTPFFTERERKQAGCQHRLFFSQIEYCDNLIFHRRAALDKLGERLLDASYGQKLVTA
jgi:hypothetical protein